MADLFLGEMHLPILQEPDFDWQGAEEEQVLRPPNVDAGTASAQPERFAVRCCADH
jgi:hypothetical protein